MRIVSADIAPRQGVQPRDLRNAAGCFTTGVTIVSSGAPGDFHATTVNSFTSLSLDPPLVVICLANSSRLREVIGQSGYFVINILSAEQASTALTCALKEKDLSTLETGQTESGATFLTENLSTIVCNVDAQHEGGDHTILVGRVRELIEGPVGEPLVFFKGQYGTFRATA